MSRGLIGYQGNQPLGHAPPQPLRLIIIQVFPFNKLAPGTVLASGLEPHPWLVQRVGTCRVSCVGAGAGGAREGGTENKRTAILIF